MHEAGFYRFDFRRRFATIQRPTARVTRRVGLSAAELADWIDKIHQLPDVRNEKIDAVAQALSAGTYDLAAKLPRALAAMAHDVPTTEHETN